MICDFVIDKTVMRIKCHCLPACQPDRVHPDGQRAIGQYNHIVAHANQA